MLFLLTVSSGSIVRSLVEEHNIGTYLSARVDEYIRHISGSPFDRELVEDSIVIEHLKTVFNISLFYPRLMKETQNNSLAPPNAQDCRSSRKIESRRSSSSSSTRSASPSNGRPASPSNGQRKTSDKIRGLFGRKSREDRSRTASAPIEEGDMLHNWGHDGYSCSTATTV